MEAETKVLERRIGAFGGTFDPIHNGHLLVAREVASRFKLDRMLMIPAHRPPHKTVKAISDAYHRYAMTVLATVNEPALFVSTIELEEPERPYTFETIERLRHVCGGDAELFFVMGADSFQEIGTWREPMRVLEGANWVVVTRPGHDIGTAHVPSQMRSRIVDLRGGSEPSIAHDEDGKHTSVTYLTDYVREDLSSTRIRQMVSNGEEIGGLVPPMVVDYIDKYELYKRK